MAQITELKRGRGSEVGFIDLANMHCDMLEDMGGHGSLPFRCCQFLLGPNHHLQASCDDMVS
jgi:hypothetical protein